MHNIPSYQQYLQNLLVLNMICHYYKKVSIEGKMEILELDIFKKKFETVRHFQL